ncbi:Endo-chitosanase [Fusarium oxysporum f. sp. albedinis]|nr:Endo-chitosanase [Fusarium oxysporum f. sp. albedinis]
MAGKEEVLNSVRYPLLPDDIARSAQVRHIDKPAPRAEILSLVSLTRPSRPPTDAGVQDTPLPHLLLISGCYILRLSTISVNLSARQANATYGDTCKGSRTRETTMLLSIMQLRILQGLLLYKLTLTFGTINLVEFNSQQLYARLP